jgi:hypothetical protein
MTNTANDASDVRSAGEVGYRLGPDEFCHGSVAPERTECLTRIRASRVTGDVDEHESRRERVFRVAARD